MYWSIIALYFRQSDKLKNISHVNNKKLALRTLSFFSCRVRSLDDSDGITQRMELKYSIQAKRKLKNTHIFVAITLNVQ